jgi:hypothetical protein
MRMVQLVSLSAGQQLGGSYVEELASGRPRQDLGAAAHEREESSVSRSNGS